MAQPWRHLRGPQLDFTPRSDLAPFRSFAGGGTVSSGALGAALIGIDTPSEMVSHSADMETRLRANLCPVLLEGWTTDSPVPVTYFTDIRCPICIGLERDLARLIERRSASIHLTTREFPIFGTVSIAAAQAILAAKEFGAAEAMRSALRRGAGPVSRGRVVQIAEQLNLVPDELISAMEGDAVAQRLMEDTALARILRLPGTPALLIGRTVVVGRADLSTLEALVDAERQEGPPPCVEA